MGKIPKNLSDKEMFKNYQEEPTIEETFQRLGKDLFKEVFEGRFRERLDALGVFEWKSRPIAGENEDVLDWMPPSWNIQITYPDRAIDIKGPIDELPPHGTSKPGVEFRQLCEAVSELIGGRKFGQDIL